MLLFNIFFQDDLEIITIRVILNNFFTYTVTCEQFIFEGTLSGKEQAIIFNSYVCIFR